MSDLIERLRSSDHYTSLSATEEAADRIEELEKSNKNRGAAVVLAQEVIAKNDKRIEELETAFKELRKALDKEQEETK